MFSQQRHWLDVYGEQTEEQYWHAITWQLENQTDAWERRQKWDNRWNTTSVLTLCCVWGETSSNSLTELLFPIDQNDSTFSIKHVQRMQPENHVTLIWKSSCTVAFVIFWFKYMSKLIKQVWSYQQVFIEHTRSTFRMMVEKLSETQTSDGDQSIKWEWRCGAQLLWLTKTLKQCQDALK